LSKNPDSNASISSLHTTGVSVINSKPESEPNKSATMGNFSVPTPMPQKAKNKLKTEMALGRVEFIATEK
jgi:hypothetical protein